MNITLSKIILLIGCISMSHMAQASRPEVGMVPVPGLNMTGVPVTNYYLQEVTDSALNASTGYIADALAYGKEAVSTVGTWMGDVYGSASIDSLSSEKKAALGVIAAGLAGYGVYRSWFGIKPGEGFLGFATYGVGSSVKFSLNEDRPHKDLLLALLNCLAGGNFKTGVIGENEALIGIIAEINTPKNATEGAELKIEQVVRKARKNIVIKYAMNTGAWTQRIQTITVNPFNDYGVKQLVAYYVLSYFNLQMKYNHAFQALDQLPVIKPQTSDFEEDGDADQYVQEGMSVDQKERERELLDTAYNRKMDVLQYQVERLLLDMNYQALVQALDPLRKKPRYYQNQLQEIEALQQDKLREFEEKWRHYNPARRSPDQQQAQTVVQQQPQQRSSHVSSSNNDSDQSANDDSEDSDGSSDASVQGRTLYDADVATIQEAIARQQDRGMASAQQQTQQQVQPNIQQRAALQIPQAARPQSPPMRSTVADLQQQPQQRSSHVSSSNNDSDQSANDDSEDSDGSSDASVQDQRLETSTRGVELQYTLISKPLWGLFGGSKHTFSYRTFTNVEDDQLDAETITSMDSIRKINDKLAEINRKDASAQGAQGPSPLLQALIGNNTVEIEYSLSNGTREIMTVLANNDRKEKQDIAIAVIYYVTVAGKNFDQNVREQIERMTGTQRQMLDQIVNTFANGPLYNLPGAQNNDQFPQTPATVLAQQQTQQQVQPDIQQRAVLQTSQVARPQSPPQLRVAMPAQQQQAQQSTVGGLNSSSNASAQGGSLYYSNDIEAMRARIEQQQAATVQDPQRPPSSDDQVSEDNYVTAASDNDDADDETD